MYRPSVDHKKRSPAKARIQKVGSAARHAPEARGVHDNPGSLLERSETSSESTARGTQKCGYPDSAYQIAPEAPKILMIPTLRVRTPVQEVGGV